MTPKKLKAFYKAHEIKTKIEDEKMWILGQYFISALDSTVCNSMLWRKKGSKPHHYVEKPLLQQVEEKQKNDESILTEEEKKRQTEQLFLKLRIMGANFNLNHNN